MRRLFVLAALFAIAIIAKPAAAQQADIIRGKIIGPDSQPVVNANVNVLDVSSGVNKVTKTGKDGRFNVVFPNGDGNYMIYVTAIGFAQKQQNIKRLADEEILIADIKLSPVQLAPVNVTTNAVRQSAGRNDNTTDVTGTDRAVGNGAVGAGDAGNLAALAATIPGFQLIPGLDGNPDLFSALGLNPDQNGSSLNGAPGLGADLPRDAGTNTSIGTNSADVSQGGSSGASVRTTTRAGTNYKVRTASGQGDAPQLQWTDDVGDALSSTYTRLSISGRTEGPISLDRNFYNISYQYDRRMQDAHNLFNTDPLALRTAGVSLDSVAHLRSILSNLTIPLGTSSIPDNKIQDQVRLLGVLDFQPKSAASGHQFQVSANANWTRQTSALSQGVLTSPTLNGETNRLVFQTTLRHNNFFWDKIATETWLTASLATEQLDPYLAYPTGSVLVASDLDDGTRSVKGLTFGGNSNQGNESRTALLGFVNQMRWLTGSNRHTLKFTTEVRYDNVSNDARPAFGSFSFQSLADLAANRPSAYSRQLSPQTQDAGQIVGGVSLGDAWRPSLNFQMQYGLRVDANKFITRPDFNPLLASQFGVRNDNVPNKVYFSPRAGFSWTYGEAPQIPYFEGFRPGQRATLKGMVGVFQNMGQPNAVTRAVQETGLPGSSRVLICNGPATPTPEWDLYRFNPFAAPLECADGNSPFATTVPSVTMFDPSYEQTRSVRSNLNWTTIAFGNRFTLRFDGTYSLAFKLPATVDLNFRPDARFNLENEAGRPVYVNPSSIDPRFGSIASRDSRISTDFNRVTLNRSDLHQQTAQFTTNLSPVYSNPTRFSWSLSYTVKDIRDEYYGFSSTVGNPLEKRWGIAGGPFAGGTHQFGYNLGYNFWDYVSVNWGGGFQSGSRYTPTVAGDVNGDNSGNNDRAFIFDPRTMADPAAAAAMQSLQVNGSPSARECLAKQRGQLAGRFSCVGPWMASASNLRISIQPIKLKLPPRSDISILISNPLAALDMALHGTDNVRGWGQQRSPDQNLLFVRGFDPTTRQYKYEVNERFGATSAQQSLNRSPVVVTLSVSLNVGPTRDWQSLKMSLDRGRKTTGNRVTEAAIKNTVSGAITNPMANILRSADVLGLTRKQADSLASLSRKFTLVLDSIWGPVAKYYAGMDTVYRESDAQERFVRGREAAVNFLIKVAPDVKKLLTKSQLRRLGAAITNFLEPRYLERVRSGVLSSNLGIPIFF